MKEIIGKIQRDRKYVYVIDRKGNIIKEKYNWFKDWKTYLVLALLIAALFYYSDVRQARAFVNSICVQKCMLDMYNSNSIQKSEARLNLNSTNVSNG